MSPPVSLAVRKPGQYVTSGLWENGDLSPLQNCLTGFWLVMLRLTIDPDLVFAGTPIVRIWDTVITPGQPVIPAENGVLIVEKRIDTNNREFVWDPPILCAEQATIRHKDCREVLTTYYLRFFFKYNMRVQVFDKVGAVYTVMPLSMHLTMNWLT